MSHQTASPLGKVRGQIVIYEGADPECSREEYSSLIEPIGLKYRFTE